MPQPGKPAAQQHAELRAWADATQTTTSCLHCPDWTHTGSAQEGRQASLEHRRQEHPETLLLKPRKGSKRMRKRSLRTAEEEAQVTVDAAEANRVRAEREREAVLAKIESRRVRAA